MKPMAISWIVFACVFAGSLLGMELHHILPKDYLTADLQDLIKLVTGLIATLSALVLALLISSAKASYDAQRAEVTQSAASFVVLDRILGHYGTQTSDARVLLRTVAASAIDQIWCGQTMNKLAATRSGADEFGEKLHQLMPSDDFQRLLYAQAIQVTTKLGETQALLLGQAARGSIAIPFLVVLVFWLTLLFTSFGLFAPFNDHAISVMLVGSLSVSCAVYLILQLEQPFQGLIHISSAPLRNALEIMGK